jgi:squalene synthase HpnC
MGYLQKVPCLTAFGAIAAPLGHMRRDGGGGTTKMAAFMPVDHYENFPVASILLPRRLRRAVADIYRFARSADDVADEGAASDTERLRVLAAYRAELARIEASAGRDGAVAAGPVRFDVDDSAHDHAHDPAHDPASGPALARIFIPLQATIQRHQLPIAPFTDLLSAFEQDVRTKRYETYDTVLDYCNRSANPVGRLMLHLYDAATPARLRQADAICTGLQLANFLQDVALDWDKDRVYLPGADMRRHGVTEDDIAQRRVTPRWQALMREQVDRTRALLNAGAPLARSLGGRPGFELRLVVLGGLRILQRIEAADYDIYTNRPRLGPRDWGLLLWRSLLAYPTQT